MSRAPVNAQASYDDAGNSVKAEKTAAIASGASTTCLKPAPGRVVNILVTAVGTGGDNATIHDDTGAGTGTVLAVILGAATAGTQITVDLPAASGITVVNVASGPAFTVGYN
jgi:hypothetical protein